MKKYMFTYEAQTRDGARRNGDLSADLPALTWEHIQDLRNGLKQNLRVESVVFTFAIELEG